MGKKFWWENGNPSWALLCNSFYQGLGSNFLCQSLKNVLLLTAKLIFIKVTLLSISGCQNRKKSLGQENGQKFFTLFWLSGTASNSLAGVSFEVKNSPGENDLILLVKCLQHFEPGYSTCLIPLEHVSYIRIR